MVSLSCLYGRFGGDILNLPHDILFTPFSIAMSSSQRATLDTAPKKDLPRHASEVGLFPAGFGEKVGKGGMVPFKQRAMSTQRIHLNNFGWLHP